MSKAAVLNTQFCFKLNPVGAMPAGFIHIL